MSDHPKDTPRDDPQNWPALGRMFSWVDRPGNPMRIIWILAAASALAFLADFTYEKHGTFEIENLPGFFAVFGFVGFTGLILVARLLRRLIKRPEDYYGDKSIDTEDYPPSGLDKVDNDA
ncbi:MAG: hypothetical protein COB40_05775 [Marinosulfonomonas sp.]|nr:MAG: hypothetical protein COB40_05775 [Marinosulfonomonas sp.]